MIARENANGCAGRENEKRSRRLGAGLRLSLREQVPFLSLQCANYGVKAFHDLLAATGGDQCCSPRNAVVPEKLEGFFGER